MPEVPRQVRIETISVTHETNTLAPWAELVPDTGPMTVDDLLALPIDDCWQYELVKGRLVRMPLSGGEHGEVTLVLAAALYNWVAPRQLGRVLAAETGFQLGSKSVLAADVAFVRMDRVPPLGNAARERFWQLAPDLVAEVASPGQSRNDLEAKARVWLGAWVRLVWNIWPRRQEVDVWRADATGVAQLEATLRASAGDLLDGLDVLPGFTHPLTALFAGA